MSLFPGNSLLTTAPPQERPSRFQNLGLTLAVAQVVLLISFSSEAVPDDLCPRLEGIDLECSTVRPPLGGGGSEPSWGGGCGPGCVPGYDCNGGPGVGGGGGSGGGGPGIGPIPGPDQCEERPTVCTYIRTGSAQTLNRDVSTTKVTAYTCRRTPAPSPELPDSYQLIPTTTNCKNETPLTCYLNGDMITKDGTQQPCTGQVTCPAADAGWQLLQNATPCPSTNPPLMLPLCSSLTTPPTPACPP